MKKLYLGVLLVSSFAGLSAQQVLWQKNIQSSTQDFLSQVTATIDQQYLISGSTIKTHTVLNGAKQNNGYDYHIIKLDQQGKEVWEKYFSGKNHDFLSATISTQEGGFILAGTSYSAADMDKKEESKGGSDIWVIRINEFGDELWQKTIGGTGDEEAAAVIQCKDLGFYVAGNVQNSTKGFGSKDVVVTRLDKDGNILSEIILGGKGLDELSKMIPTIDGGAILGIYSRSHIGGSKKSENYGEGDFWIVKLDKEGNVEWEKSYGGKGDDRLKTLAMTTNGYFIGGESRSGISGNKSVDLEEGTDVWLLSLNNKGEEVWQKNYNFRNRDILMGMSVMKTGNDASTKGVLLGGYTQAEGKIESSDETFWMLYLDQQGNEQWRKYVEGESRKKEERLIDLKLNRDGSILLAGTSAEELGKENWKIIKLGDKQIDQLIEKLDIRIYPNPVSDYSYVEIGFDFTEADITLYDMGGRQIQTLKTKNKVTKINTQALVQGAYLVVVKTNENKIANAKIVKK